MFIVQSENGLQFHALSVGKRFGAKKIILEQKRDYGCTLKLKNQWMTLKSITVAPVWKAVCITEHCVTGQISTEG